MGWDHAMTGGTEELVRRLRRLEPAGHTLDRDTLMFRAGQASARRRLRLWQSLAGTMLLLAAGLGWLSRTFHEPAVGRARLPPSRHPLDPDPARPEARPTWSTDSLRGDPFAVQPTHAPPYRLPTDLFAGRSRAPASDYLELRRRVTLEGVDALPSSGSAPASPEPIQTIADWLRLPRTPAFTSDPLAFSGAPTKGNPS